MGPIRKEYFYDLRCRVVQKWRAKVSTRTISKELLIPPWSIRTIIDFYKANGHCKPAPRPGRTPLTDARQDRRIVRTVEANRFVSASVVAAQVTSDVGVKVSPEVVRARVRAAGLHGRSAREKSYMSPKHRRQRLRYEVSGLAGREVGDGTVLGRSVG
ncbi:Transposase [Phytophthora infestans]|nr:Transposase [Phytophthora infestans]